MGNTKPRLSVDSTLDCNAGICVLGDFLTKDDSWRDSHIDVNIKGVWNACKAVIPSIIAAGGGAIVITS